MYVCVCADEQGKLEERTGERGRCAPDIVESRFEEPFFGLGNSHLKGMSLALTSVVRWRAADGTIWIDLGDARHCRLYRRSWSLLLCLVFLFLLLLVFFSALLLFTFAKDHPVGKSRFSWSARESCLPGRHSMQQPRPN